MSIEVFRRLKCQCCVVNVLRCLLSVMRVEDLVNWEFLDTSLLSHVFLKNVVIGDVAFPNLKPLAFDQVKAVIETIPARLIHYLEELGHLQDIVYFWFDSYLRRLFSFENWLFLSLEHSVVEVCNVVEFWGCFIVGREYFWCAAKLVWKDRVVASSEACKNVIWSGLLNFGLRPWVLRWLGSSLVHALVLAMLSARL